MSATAPENQQTPSTQDPAPAPAIAAQNRAAKTSPPADLPEPAPPAPTPPRPQKPAPKTKPYLPRPRGHATTNAVPYPSYLPQVPEAQRQLANAYWEWHLRLNHTPFRKLHLLALHYPACGLPVSLQQPPPPMCCRGCNAGHHSPAPHKSTAPVPPIGHTIATDLLGPLPNNAEGFEHIITVTELHTCMRFITLLKRKSNAPDALLGIISKIQRHTNSRVARVRCDNANEFLTQSVLSLS